MRLPRALRYGLLAALAVGGVLLFLLASASTNSAFFERNYPVLLGINGVIAALLFVLVLALIRRLVGSYSGVVGLPVYETRALLRAAGYPIG